MEELLEEALVPEEEQLYKVPGNWGWCRLDQYAVCLDKYRKPINAEERAMRVGDIPYYGATGRIGWIDDFLTNEELVILGEDGAPFLDPFKNKAYMIKGKAWVNNHAHILKSRFGPDGNKFLQYFLNQFDYRNFVSGTTRLKLTQKQMNKIPIPVPPVKEQKRIAGKVEQLLSKIDEAKRLIEEAKETFELRRAAILDKAFRGELTRKWREQHPEIESAEVLYNKIIRFMKPNNVSSNVEQKLNIPDTWKMVRLGEVVQVNPPKKKLEEISDQQICTFVPMPAVSDKTGKIESPEEKEYAKVKKGYTFFLENDVLFAKITPCMENGKSAIAKNLKNGFGFGSTEFHVLRTNEYINERYLHYLVRSKKFRLEAKGEMTGAVGQQRVPKEFLVNYPFPLPPKEEQDAIVDILDEIFTRDDIAYRIIDTKYELETLKQSILSKAFRGELGTNDPTEESAIELLKEVLQEQVK
jgi:type I restriction enzyme S subunit